MARKPPRAVHGGTSEYPSVWSFAHCSFWCFQDRRRNGNSGSAQGPLSFIRVILTAMPHNSTQKFALSVTRWIGSPASIIIHTALFIASFAAAMQGYVDWDK